MNTNINFPNISIDPFTVHIYTGCGFTGANAELTFSMDLAFRSSAGFYDSRYLELKGITPSNIQSFIVGPKTKIELYEYDKFGGRVFVIYNSTSLAKYVDCYDDLQFNMYIRSIKIYPALNTKLVYATMFNSPIHKEIWEKQQQQIEGFDGLYVKQQICDNQTTYAITITLIIMFLIICYWKYKI